MTTVTVVIVLEDSGDCLFNKTNATELEDHIRDYFEGNAEIASITVDIKE